jgi:hypothetical protein
MFGKEEGYPLKRILFRSNKRSSYILKALLALVTLCVLIGVGIFELYQFLNPFSSLNPLYHEITAGQKVIDNWVYEGKDKDGDLIFYYNYETHLLPPGSHKLALDGKYVVIEKATENSLTFAEPVEAIPYQWFLPVIVFGGALLFLRSLIRKRKRPMRIRQSRKMWAIFKKQTKK